MNDEYCRRCRYKKCLQVGMKSCKVGGVKRGTSKADDQDTDMSQELEMLNNKAEDQSRNTPVVPIVTNIDRPCLLYFDEFENARKGSVEIWDSVFFEEYNGEFYKIQFELCKNIETKMTLKSST